MATVTDYVDGFDNIRVLECGANTEFCGNLLLVFLLGLTRSFGPELLNSEDITAVLSLDQPDGAASARTEDSAPFTVLLSKVSLCGFGEGSNRVRNLGGNFAVHGRGGGMRSTRVNAVPCRLELLGR